MTFPLTLAAAMQGATLDLYDPDPRRAGRSGRVTFEIAGSHGRTLKLELNGDR